MQFRGALSAVRAPRGVGQLQPIRGGPISAEPRINDRIRVPEVRLVGPEGEQVGIVAIHEALRLAQESDLDLVEVAPMARPPVCKLMDYGKFKYESALKAREARKKTTLTVIKEIKLRPKIDPHDYGTKKGHVVRFLTAGDKVKVTIMFRGREQSRPELGFNLLKRLADDVQELGFVEASPKQDGRNMIMVLAPHRTVKAQATARSEDAAAARPSRAAARAAAGGDDRPAPAPRPAAAPAASAAAAPQDEAPLEVPVATPAEAPEAPAAAAADTEAPSAADTSAGETEAAAAAPAAPAAPAKAARAPAKAATKTAAAKAPAKATAKAPAKAAAPKPSAPPKPGPPKPGPPKPAAPAS